MDVAVRNVRDLRVWNEAMDLVIDCYRVARKFPADERFSLCDQLRRSAVSIPVNIAEGQARTYTKEYLRYLSIARGSLAETETHLEIATRLNYLPEQELKEIMEKTKTVGKMLNGLRSSLTRKAENRTLES